MLPRQPAVSQGQLGRRTTLMVDDSGGMVGWIDAKGKNVLIIVAVQGPRLTRLRWGSP